MDRSESSLAALLLTQRLVEGDAEPLKASEYWSLVDRLEDPADLLDRSSEALASELGVEEGFADRIVKRMAQAAQVAFALDEAEQSGLRLLSSLDEAYPAALIARLGRAAPPLLYVVGDVDLLSSGGLGIVGSRNVAPEAGELAKEAARFAAGHRLTVVSGGAKGVDRLAMGAALDADGAAVGVLADSLTRTVKDADLRRAVLDGKLCLCTPYKPSAGFTVATAMGRNKLIYALSVGTLVVASEKEKGGTWSGAVEALRNGYAPVVVWTGEGAGTGNAALAARGAGSISDIDHLPLLRLRLDEAAAKASRSVGVALSQLAFDL